jgi:hypothetical protein
VVLVSGFSFLLKKGSSVEDTAIEGEIVIIPYPINAREKKTASMAKAVFLSWSSISA